MPINPYTGRSDLDVLAKMARPSWRELEFECSAMEWGFSQSHAQHLYPDRDAGYIESTGRNPSTFKFTAMFRNGIVTKDALPAFPGQWTKFVQACADRSAGKLSHPALGTLTVKCTSFSSSWVAEKRDGADVSVEFIEATDEASELDALLAQGSPLGNCFAEARNLDDALGNVSPVPTLPQSLKPSLLDSIKQLSGAIEQFKLGVGQIAGKIDSYASAVGQLADSIRDADDPKSYRALEACDRLFASLLRLSEEVTRKAKPLSLALLPFTTNLAGAAKAFGMTVADFVQYNPTLASRATLPVGTPVVILL